MLKEAAIPRLKHVPSRLNTIGNRLKSAAAPQHRDTLLHWRAWYKTARWRLLRQAVFERDGYICQRTGTLCIGKHPAPDSPVANHKVPHNGDPDLFWDINNIETVSKHAHDSVIQAEESSAAR